MSFKLKIFFVLLMVSIVPYAISLMIFSVSYKQEQRTNIIDEMRTQLGITVGRIQAQLNTLRSDTLFLSRSDIMNDLVTKDLDRRISKMLLDKKTNLELYGDFFATNNKGLIIASSNLTRIGTKLIEKPFFTVPIITPWNKNIGDIHVTYQLENFRKFFTNLEYRHYYLKTDTLHDLFKPKRFHDSFSIKKELPYFKGYKLVLEEDSDNAFKILRKYEQWFLIGLIVGTLAIAIISYFFASRLITPIIALSKTATKITNTQDYKQQVYTQERNDEIGDLTSAFNTMIRSMDNALDKNILLTKDIVDTQKEVIFTMGTIGESRSLETGNHVKRVAEYSFILAKSYGLDDVQCNMLKLVSPMHDIGKVAIPDAILLKPGRLNEEEFEEMKKHAVLGFEMLNHSKRELLNLAAITAHEHHEKWDGTGYPRGIKEKEIHIFGRITALADVFDALGSKRIYKKAWEDQEIFDYLKANKAIAFEPELVDL
ncbi:MAG: HD domain-containing protein, partial [Thiovulaceae bacterium]|nr:HD domain-containing protein [Sulfurimonadaceae bacterium]